MGHFNPLSIRVRAVVRAPLHPGIQRGGLVHPLHLQANDIAVFPSSHNFFPPSPPTPAAVLCGGCVPLPPAHLPGADRHAGHHVSRGTMGEAQQPNGSVLSWSHSSDPAVDSSAAQAGGRFASLLAQRARRARVASGGDCHCCYDHCQPGAHHRQLLHRAAGTL